MMSEPIKIEYRGIIVTYSDNFDEWWASEMNYSNVSLAKVKARIDKFYLDQRKASAVECFEISQNHHLADNKATESTIIEFVKTRYGRVNYDTTPATREVEGYQVAVIARREGRERAARRETDLKYLMPNTPEALAAFDHANELRRIANAHERAARDAFEAIPRVTVDMVAELKRIKESEVEE